MFITHFDSNYFRWGKILLQSHKLNYPNGLIYVSGVNLSETQVKELKSINQNAIIDNELINLKSIPITKTRDRWGGTTGHNLPEYMACRKSWVLQTAFEKFPNENCYIMTDADIFINRRYDFEHNIENYDGCFLLGGDPGQSGQGLHTQVMSGLIVLKNNQASKKLVDRWVFHIKNNNRIQNWKQWEWFWDQITLNLSLEEVLKEDYSLFKIPHRYFVNTEMSEDAFMWSPHTGGEERKERMYHLWNNVIKEVLNGEVDE